MFRGFRGFTRERVKDTQSQPVCMSIKPQTNLTIEEAKAYWDKLFDSIDDLPDEFIEEDEIDMLPDFIE